MKKALSLSNIYILIALLFLHIESVSAVENSQAEAEALFSRRLIEFWRDKDFNLFEKQAILFFKTYPKSIYTEKLQLMLGEAYLEGKQYEKALAIYKVFKSTDTFKKVISKYLVCLYKLNQFDDLSKEISHQKGFSEQESLFYRSEVIFAKKIDKASLKELLTLRKNYESLADTSYKIISLFRLADVYKKLELYEKAAETYLTLTKLVQKDSSFFMYQAATSYSYCDLNQALSLYFDIWNKDTAYSSVAALQWMKGLIKNNDTSLLFKYKEQIRSRITEKELIKYQILLARGYLVKGDYTESLDLTKNIFSRDNQATDSEKIEAYLLFLESSYRRGDSSPILREYAEEFRHDFSQSSEYAQVQYIYSLALSRESLYKESSIVLYEVLETYPKSSLADKFLFQIAQNQYQQGLYLKSKETIDVFLQQYPHSSYKKTVKKLAINNLIELSKSGDKTSTYQLIQELFLALETKQGMIEASERANFQLLLAKLYYDTHQHDRSLSVSESFIKRYPSHQEVYKAHFLLALLYLQKQQETEFIFHAELVLKLNKNCSEASRLHYNLFSTYLNRSKQEAVEKHKRLALNKGAQHLYKAYFLEPTLLSSDHTYWLASQLYSEIKMSKDLNLCQDYKKLIEHVLPLSELSVRNKPLNNKEEKILFYYTQVLGFLDFSEKRKTVLQLMEKMYELYPLHEGGSIADVFFELSLYFRDIKDFDQSILYLKKIFLLSERKAPIIYQKSQLLYSRMKLDQYQRMDTFHIENEELHLVLGILKDLQIKKYLLTEPIHLESALEYAHARVLLEPKDQRLGMFLGILEKIKKQFTSEDDIQGKDYREMRKTNVDKDNLFQAYMELIDGKISLVKAALSQDENQKRQLLKKADSIFQHLKISSSIFSNYFNQEVQKGLKHHVVSE